MAQFYLRTKKTDGKAKLYTLVRRNGLNLQVCTGIVVSVKDWQKSEKSQSAKTKYYATDEGKRVNENIISVTQAINILFDEGRINTKEDKYLIEQAITDVVTVEAQRVKEQAKAIKKEQEGQIIPFLDMVCKGMENGSIRNHGKRYSRTTIKGFNDSAKVIRLFLADNENMTFNEIDRQTADNFTAFLEGRGYMKQTRSTITGHFHRLCSLATEMGNNKSATALKVWHRQKADKEEATTKIYLTDEEINALYAMNLAGRQERARDLFLLGCLTCQRYSDFTCFGKDNFKQTDNGTHILCLKQQKTGTYVEIPVYDGRVIAICEKYNYRLPKCDDSDFNKVVKIVLEKLAETVPTLQEKFPTTITKQTAELERNFAEMDALAQNGGQIPNKDARTRYRKLKKYATENNGQPLFERNEKGEIMRHKWELVSSHTARRSGITNLYKTGILDSREIMSISGHKTEQIYKEYIKITVSEQADRIFAKLAAAKK